MEGLPDWLADNLMGLERSDFGEAIRMTPNLYPILMSVHVIGIALLLGSALIVDLRLLGVARHVVPVTVVARYLLPVAHVGFSIVVLTGLSMFSGIAVSVASSSAAPWKFGLIAVAGLNIAVFQWHIPQCVAVGPACSKPAAGKDRGPGVGLFLGRRRLCRTVPGLLKEVPISVIAITRLSRAHGHEPFGTVLPLDRLTDEHVS